MFCEDSGCAGRLATIAIIMIISGEINVPAKLFRDIALAVLLVLALASSSPAQSRHPMGPETPAEDAARIRMEKDMAKKANQQRQAELKRDTEKLLQLATELKTYVDKTNENLLSINVVNKAEEIEKLAHNVREKMRGSN